MAPLLKYFIHNQPESVQSTEEALNNQLGEAKSFTDFPLIFLFLLILICIFSMWCSSNDTNNVGTPTPSNVYGQLEMQVGEQPVAENASNPTDTDEEADETASESGGSEDEFIDEEHLMDMTCQICMVNRKDRILLPCGHLFCSECAIRVKRRCFICKSRVKSVKTCYL